MGLKFKSLLLALLAFSTCSFAQNYRIETGIVGGIGLRNLRGNELLKKNNTSAPGFAGGLSFQYNFSEKIALHMDVAFDRKGAVGHVDQLDSNGNSVGKITTHSNFDYLTLPLMLRYTMHKKVDLFFQVGGYGAYLLKQNFVVKQGDTGKVVVDNSYKDQPLDFGISLGFGLSIPIKERLALNFEIRDNFGLFNVSKVEVYKDGSIKTNNTMLMCGLVYRLGKKG
jgi:hypothetical protein